MKTSFYIKFVDEKPFQLSDKELIVLYDDEYILTKAVENIKEKLKIILHADAVDILFVDCIDNQVRHDTQITLYISGNSYTYYAYTSFVDTI